MKSFPNKFSNKKSSPNVKKTSSATAARSPQARFSLFAHISRDKKISYALIGTRDFFVKLGSDFTLFGRLVPIIRPHIRFLSAGSKLCPLEDFVSAIRFQTTTTLQSGQGHFALQPLKSEKPLLSGYGSVAIRIDRAKHEVVRI